MERCDPCDNCRRVARTIPDRRRLASTPVAAEARPGLQGRRRVARAEDARGLPRQRGNELSWKINEKEATD
jgi:hypothetical protein